MFVLLIFFSCYLISINAHGYLFEPIARSSAWLTDPAFKECCTYSSHMEMFCGGVGHQWITNGGKCSICGEPYDRAVKLFEKGGRMYLGKIVETYTQGQQIDVKVKLSANHQGYFEFRLCNLDNNPNSDATEECLDQYLLTIVETNLTKYQDITKHGSDMIIVRVQLPSNLACQHCVFQWKYTTGNNWGKDPVTNKSGPGLGRENETFMGCSDITIIAIRTTTIRPPITITRKKTTTIKRNSTSKSQIYWSGLSTKHRLILSTLVLSLFPASKSAIYWPVLLPKSSSTTSSLKPRSTVSTVVLPVLSIATTTITPRPPVRLPLWSALLFAYQKGDEVMYNGMKYRCVTSHRSYAGAEPGLLTWALWRKIE